jgi:Nucleotidyl transferase AbiEii toxin, Type IV TA system
MSSAARLMRRGAKTTSAATSAPAAAAVLAGDPAGPRGPGPVGGTLPRASPCRLMDPLQERLARIGLQVVGRRGFVLGGGHAIGLHGMGDRPSEDIDLFSAERGSPAAVAGKLLDAEAREGFTVMISLRTADLVQMEVTDVKGQSCKVDLGVFWRARVPVVLEVGPVLHPDDAVAGKVDALFLPAPHS